MWIILETKTVRQSQQGNDRLVTGCCCCCYDAKASDGYSWRCSSSFRKTSRSCLLASFGLACLSRDFDSQDYVSQKMRLVQSSTVRLSASRRLEADCARLAKSCNKTAAQPHLPVSRSRPVTHYPTRLRGENVVLRPPIRPESCRRRLLASKRGTLKNVRNFAKAFSCLNFSYQKVKLLSIQQLKASHPFIWKVM